MTRPVVSLSPSVVGLEPSATLAINERSRRAIAEGRSVYRLGLGQSPFPVPKGVVDALRDHAAEKDYLPVKGLPALREAVSAYHHRRHGAAVGPDDVLIAPGSKELMFLLQVTYRGTLLIPTPAWVSYAPQAHILERRVELLATSAERRYKLDPAVVDAWCRAHPEQPALLILNSPSNPTGVAYTASELGELAEVLRHHRLLVLSDEIYGELHFEGAHTSIVRHYPEGTILSSGLSKWCGAGGWRLGTFAMPRELRPLLDAMAAVASETYTSTSAPIQHAAVRAFRGGEAIEAYLGTARRILAALVGHTVQRLRETGLEVVAPDGAFYVFPSFEPVRARLAARGIRTSAALAAALFEATGVAGLPGSDFGRPEEELTLRLALVDFDGARAMAQADLHPVDEAFLELNARPVVEAIRRIAAFAA